MRALQKKSIPHGLVRSAEMQTINSDNEMVNFYKDSIGKETKSGAKANRKGRENIICKLST